MWPPTAQWVSHESSLAMVSWINYARDPLEREADVAGLSGMDVQPMLLLARPKLIVATDSLPEWSKGVDSSSTSANCVGSNPTAVILATSSHWKLHESASP